MKKLLVLIPAIMLVTLAACNGVGGGASNNPSISAAVTSGNCSNFTATGESCVITLTYNVNGASNPSLAYAPNPLPAGITNNGAFNTSFGACQTSVSNAGSGTFTCPINIIYTSGVGGSNFNLTFTINSSTANPATSNAIPIKGN